MLDLKFTLNDEELSLLRCSNFSFPAYSGNPPYRNKRNATGIKNIGPLPFGRYHIVDRESGGWFGALMDWIKGKDVWFALYAIDEKIDDFTYCNNVKRGQFRLHPAGPNNSSMGCITITTVEGFNKLRSLLLGTTTKEIDGLKAYGIVTVE